jgi:hypothetical protein
MEASFRAYISRPEVRPLVEAHERRRALAAVRRAEREQAEALRAAVLALPEALQRAVATLLPHAPLRGLLLSLSRDPERSLEAWLSTEALALMSAARDALMAGRVSEAALREALRAALPGGGDGRRP